MMYLIYLLCCLVEILPEIELIFFNSHSKLLYAEALEILSKFDLSSTMRKSLFTNEI